MSVRLSMISLLITCSFLTSTVRAQQWESICLTWSDNAGSVVDNFPADNIMSDGQGAYCNGQIAGEFVDFRAKNLQGRGLWLDLSWYDGESPFADIELPISFQLRRIQFRCPGIQDLQPEDGPKETFLIIYFDVGDREFGLHVSKQEFPIIAQATAGGLLTITGSPMTRGRIIEYIGNGRKTQVPVVGETFVQFEAVVARQ